MILRNADADQASICYQFTEDARAFRKSVGFEQWRPDDPALHTSEKDTAKGVACVFAANGKPVEY